MNVKRVMGEVVEIEPVMNEDGTPAILKFYNINKAIFRMRNLTEQRQTFVCETT